MVNIAKNNHTYLNNLAKGDKSKNVDDMFLIIHDECGNNEKHEETSLINLDKLTKLKEIILHPLLIMINVANV